MWRYSVGLTLLGLWGLAMMSSAHAEWKPRVNQVFDIQFTTPFNFVRPVDVLELDLFDTSQSRLQELRARGVATICYINAGAWENWRPDKGDYPPGVIGRYYNGWPGERWLDIRQIDTLGPILRRRLDLCKDKGFDGVDFDNVDGYTNQTGFPLTAPDQLKFNKWLAAEAKKRGLMVGLKNDLDQVADLVSHFDFAVSESCLEFNECNRLQPFLQAGKPIYVVEYTNVRRKMDAHCATAARQGLQVIFKTKTLNGKLHRRCPE